MALQECRECKKEISTSAQSCPNCGAVVPTKASAIGLLLAVVVMAGLGVWWFDTFGGPIQRLLSRLS